jgi:solute carrier family 45 protein 1/2/4
MSYVNVYLLSLGMSKSHLSVIWVFGPLSGLIMQPVVGVLSDHSTNKYGRRRPYIMIGSLLVSLGLIIMAWARDIVGIFPFSESTVSVTLITPFRRQFV